MSKYLEMAFLEVKWALESITTNKASGGDGIPVELFQILKDDAVKLLHSICQQIRKTQQWPQDWKRSVFILIPKKGNAKECSNYRTIALISHTSLVVQTVKRLPAVWETPVRSLGREDPLVPWRRAWQPTPVFLPGESHGQRSLAGYSPWGCKELDMTERLHFHTVVK